MNELVENYLQLLQEDEIITEDIRSFLGRLSDRKLNNFRYFLSKAFKRKDKEGIKRILSTVPVISDDKLKYVAKKFSPNFNLPYRLTFSYIKRKYPNVPDTIASYLAIAVGVMTGREDKPEEKTKDLLLKFDKNLKKALRGQLREQDPDDPRTVFSGGFAWGFFSSALVTLLLAWLSAAGTPMIAAGIVILVFGAIMVKGSI